MSEVLETTAISCTKMIMSVHDALDILNGRWKISIIAALHFNKKRYSDLLRDIDGISGKMLSRDLKDLEINQLISRTVVDTKPITVEYELTAYGQTLDTVIESLSNWGIAHRKKITGR